MITISEFSNQTISFLNVFKNKFVSDHGMSSKRDRILSNNRLDLKVKACSNANDLYCFGLTAGGGSREDERRWVCMANGIKRWYIE